MKGKWILTVSLLAASSLTSVSADSIAFRRKVLSTPGLIGYWPFEDSLIDLSPNANDGHVKGDPAAITFGPGINGGRALDKVFKDKGIRHEWVESEGYRHDYQIWRIYLRDLLPRLFRD